MKKVSSPRFFVNAENKKEDLIYIVGEENTHLNSVLRLRVGEKVEVCIDDGYVYHCELIEINKRESVARIQSSVLENTLAPITIFIALIKAEKMDFAIQKVTELGVAGIVTFESEYCTVKDKGNKVDRLNRIAVSASKQSKRAKLPKIEGTLGFDEVLQKLQNFDQVVVAYENETQNAKEILCKLDKNKSIALVIGSEGGFSKSEIDALKQYGAKVISMGQTILRAETACVSLVSAVNYELGLWENNK